MVVKSKFLILGFLAVSLSAAGTLLRAGSVQRTRLPGEVRRVAPFLQQAKSYEETTYVTKIVLKNGMTVLVDEYHLQPVVAIQAYIRVGFFDDPAKISGRCGRLPRPSKPGIKTPGATATVNTSSPTANCSTPMSNSTGTGRS